MFSEENSPRKLYTALCHLTVGIGSEKCLVRQFCCANIIEYTYHTGNIKTNGKSSGKMVAAGAT